jgi:DNA repair exonuclease SbcCD nuclease subunit
MIKKIFHVSDLHIRTFQLHDLYRTQFERFIKSVKEQIIGFKHDEVRIVITGDIFHNKISISNEQVLLTAWLFDELSKLGILIILPGNHDFLENNMERMDSITPIIELLRNPNIRYYKDMGTYDDNNVTWVVYSLYQHNQRPEFEKVPTQFYVGLFHDPIQGMSTDLGYNFEDGYDKLNFVGCDLVLCGDIHKRSILKLGNTQIVMIGSCIQQGQGETIKHHGYGIYNFEDNKYSFVDLENDQPFMHFKITDFTDIENEREELLNLG